MQKKYRYRLDRRGRRITAVVTILLVTAFVAFHFVWGANYLPAWMLFLLLCVVLLYILSIPRYISLDDTSIDIHCIVDLTRIHLEDVELIRRIEPTEFRRLWPLLGSYGFWGGRRECFLTECLSLYCRHPHCGARRRFAAAVRRSRFSGEPEYRASKS